MRAPYCSIGSTSVFALQIKQEFPVWEMLRSCEWTSMWKQHYFGALKFSLDQDSQMPVQYKCVCSSIYLQDYCKAEAACFFLKYSRNTSSTTPLKGVVLMRQISWYPVLSLLLSLAVLFLALPFAGSDASECSAPTSNARRHPKSFWSGLWNWNKLS